MKGPSGRTARIMEGVAPKWKDFAILLGFNGPKITSLDRGVQKDPEDACREMFICWLDGGNNQKPVTWESIIECLVDTELSELAINVVKLLTLNSQLIESDNG